jgi:hypothetical protein
MIQSVHIIYRHHVVASASEVRDADAEGVDLTRYGLNMAGGTDVRVESWRSKENLRTPSLPPLLHTSARGSVCLQRRTRTATIHPLARVQIGMADIYWDSESSMDTSPLLSMHQPLEPRRCAR